MEPTPTDHRDRGALTGPRSRAGAPGRGPGPRRTGHRRAAPPTLESGTRLLRGGRAVAARARREAGNRVHPARATVRADRQRRRRGSPWPVAPPLRLDLVDHLVHARDVLVLHEGGEPVDAFGLLCVLLGAPAMVVVERHVEEAERDDLVLVADVPC